MFLYAIFTEKLKPVFPPPRTQLKRITNSFSGMERLSFLLAARTYNKIEIRIISLKKQWFTLKLQLK